MLRGRTLATHPADPGSIPGILESFSLLLTALPRGIYELNKWRSMVRFGTIVMSPDSLKSSNFFPL